MFRYMTIIITLPTAGIVYRIFELKYSINDVDGKNTARTRDNNEKNCKAEH